MKFLYFLIPRFLPGMILPCICFAQFPATHYTSEQLIKNNIDTLEVYLDSAARGYQLDISPIALYCFDHQGRVTQRITYTSDIYLTVQLDKYYYYTDSTVQVRRDSAQAVKNYDVTYVKYYVSHFKNGHETKSETYTTYSGPRTLDVTELNTYDTLGRLINTKRVHPQSPLVRALPVETNYFYDKKNQLIKSEEFKDGKLDYTELFEYNKNEVRCLRKRKNSDGSDYISSVINNYNNQGQLIKKTYEDDKGNLMFFYVYTYNHEGLMETETSYGKNNKLQYRFISKYK